VTRPSFPSPFRLRGGRVWLERLALDELVPALGGRAVLLLGHGALGRALARARRAAGGSLTVPVSLLGPREALAACAEAGDWALASSRHELALALAAGFPRSRVAVSGDVLEDGVLVDALTGGVGALHADTVNVARLAAGLGLPVPPATALPPRLPEAALRRVGGLLAPLLSGPPSLVLDAGWEPAGRARVAVLPLRGPADAPPSEASIRGLPPAAPARARLHGPAARGDWVAVPDPRAARVLLPDPAHPRPPTVMVRGGAWRLLDPRPWPADAAPPG
jgi:hypothetical protein